MKKAKRHEGGCLCGQIRYKIDNNPEYVGLCHCRYCQMRTGSAVGISVYFVKSSIGIVDSAKQLNSYNFITEMDGNFTIRFCGNCGTSLFWEVTTRPGLMAIAGGTFDPPTFWYEVEREIFCRSKATFLSTNVTDKYDTHPEYKPRRDEKFYLRGG